MIIVVVGPPCAGKSTIVQESANPGDLIVDYDLIARALGANGHRPQGIIKHAAFAARTAVVDLALSELDEETAWIIHTNPTEEQVRSYREAGAQFMVVDPGMDECLRRAEHDERPDGTADVIRAWYENPPDLEELLDEPAKGLFAAQKEGLQMETKKFTIKAPAEGRSFEGYASTWTTVPDSYGDIVERGAFADTLAQLRESGKSLPVLWAHEYYNPSSFVAKVVDIEEDDHGLRVKGEFFDDPEALKVHQLIKEGLVNEMSFAFNIQDAEDTTVDGMQVRKLKKLDLYEVSIVVFGANPDTSIESVKVSDRLTSEEIATLKEMVAKKFAFRGEEVAGKSFADEAALRIENNKSILEALAGREGDSE